MKKKGIALLTVMLLSLTCLLVACKPKVYNFKVIFYMDTQGTQVYKEVDASSDADIPLPEDPVNSDTTLEFKGWFTDQRGTEEFDPAGYRGRNTNLSVYPKWEQKPSEGLAYTLLSNGTYQVIGMGTCTDTKLVIPDRYPGTNGAIDPNPDENTGSDTGDDTQSDTNGGIAVTSIAAGAFKNQTGLTKVVLPETIQQIRAEAFMGCTNLKSMVLTTAGTLQYIGNDAFKDCPHVVFYTASSEDANVITHGWGQWNADNHPVYWNTSKVYEENGIEYIVVEQDDAQDGSVSLGISDIYITRYLGSEETLTIPSEYSTDVSKLVLGGSVNLHIGQNAFDDCAVALTFPDAGLSKLDDGAFAGYIGETLILPSIINELGENVFYGCTAAVDIGAANLTSLTDYAFAGYQGETLTIPANIETIGRYVFSDCTAELTFAEGCKVTKLDVYSMTNYKGEKLTVPSHITSIERFAFVGAEADIDLKETALTEIVKNTFNGYNGTSIELPSTVKTIGERAFYNCNNLETLTLPDGLESITLPAIYANEALTSIEISENNSNYSTVNGVLYDKSGSTLIAYPAGREGDAFTIPENVTSIAPYAFYGSKLTDIELSDGLSSISENAFENCKNLKYILIPDTVATIKSNAFAGCDLLVIGVAGSSIPAGWSGFNPDDCLVQFNAGEIITDETTHLEFMIRGNDVAVIGYKGVSDTLTIPEKVQTYNIVEIMALAFKGNTTVKTIELNASITAIGASAFEDSAIEVVTANGVTSIGNGAFRNSNLDSITCPALTSLGAYAFEGTKITSLSAPSLAEIGEYAFHKTELADITTGNITVLESHVFAETALIEYTVPASVTEIKDQVFANTPITKLEIPDTVTNIGENILLNCTEVTDLKLSYIGSSLERSISNSANNRIGYLFGFNMVFETLKIELTGNIETLGSNFSASYVSHVILPATVKAIGDGAFDGCSNLQTIELKGSLTTLGNYAFRSCAKLETVEISNVTKIGEAAFNGCTAIDGLTLNDAITNLDKNTFYGCESLTSLAIPAGVTAIKESTFQNCSALTTLTIAGNVATIERNAFNGCSSLKSLELKGVETVAEYAFANCSADVTIQGSIQAIVINTFNNYLGTSVTLSNSVTEIGVDAFIDSVNLRTISAPGVTAVREEAFINCAALEAFDLSRVTTLERKAFKGCASLKSVTINSAIKTLPKNIFNGCSALSEVDLGEVTEISLSAFENCISLYTINISKVTSIRGYAFRGCINLGDLTLHSNIETVRAGAFDNCSKLVLTVQLSEQEVKSKWETNWDRGVLGVFYNSATSSDSLYVDKSNNNISVYRVEGDNYTLVAFVGSGDVTIENTVNNKSVTKVADNAFRDLNLLTSVTLPESVKEIGASCFYGCEALVTVTASGVTTLGESVFAGCKALTSVTLGTLANNGNNPAVPASAFDGCSSLEKLELKIAEGSTIGAYAFRDVQSNITITGNSLVLSDYAFAGYKGKEIDLSNFASIGAYAFSGATAEITMSNTADKIDDYVFANYLGSKIELNEKITSIGVSAFAGCINLTELTIPATVTSIGRNAFYNVSATVTFNETSVITEIGEDAFNSYMGTTLELPTSVTTIKDRAFAFAKNLTSIDLSKVTVIGSEAFSGCVSLGTVTIGSLDSLGAKAFANCVKLQEIDLKGKLTKVEDYTFYNCAKLNNITLADTITALGVGAFYGCSSLAEITLPTGLTTIGDEAFYMCASLIEIDIPASVQSIGERVFVNCVALTEITVQDGANYKAQDGVLYNKEQTRLICYPAGKISEENPTFTIPASVNSVAGYAFAFSKLEQVFIHKDVTTIEAYAFYGCTSLSIYCEAAQNADHQGFAANWNYCPSHSNGTDTCNIIWGYVKQAD